jgi:hypothetical protein
LQPWLIPFLLVAGAAAGLLTLGWRLGARTRARAITGLVALDLVAFAVLTVVAVDASPPDTAHSTAPRVSTAPHPTSSSAATLSSGSTSRTVALSALRYGGRYAVYDPDLVDPSQLAALGAPDRNAADQTWSVQGYSSIVDGSYAAATGSHGALGDGQDDLSVRALAAGTFDQLDLRLVATLPRYLRPGTPLQRALVRPRWAPVGRDGPFLLFANQKASPPLRVVGTGGRPVPGAVVRSVQGPSLAPSRAEVRSPVAVTVVRAVADGPGWYATWRRMSGGPAHPAPVRRFGLVQAVDVPAGRVAVQWTYDPPGWTAGLLLGGVGVLAILVLLALALLIPHTRGSSPTLEQPSERRQIDRLTPAP